VEVDVGRLLIIGGVVLVVIGLLIQAGLPLGRLPGDIRIQRGNFTLYSPLMTGLLVSVALTILINLLLRR
jgi:hypothetical protein